MIKKVLFVLIGSFVVIACAKPAYADNWSQFMRISSRFYHFDVQNFKSISCRIRSPWFDNVVSEMKAIAAGKAVVTDTLSAYHFVYKKSGSLDFHDPVIDVRVTATGKVADPDKMKLGISEIKRAVRQQSALVDRQIRNLLYSTRTPDRSKTKIEKISESAGVYTVIYFQDGIEKTSVVSGNTVATVSHRGSASITSEAHYHKMNSGKLLLRSANVHSKGIMRRIDGTISIDYQDLDGMIFPRKIENNGTVKLMDGTVTQHIDENILIADCVLQKP